MLVDYTDESEVVKYLPKTVTTDRGTELPLFDSNGRIIHANLPASVPGDYIKVADFRGIDEIFASLGTSIKVEGEEIKPPSLGVWSLLESFKCPFVNQFGAGLEMIHCYRALYVNYYREDCAQEICDWFNSGRDQFEADDDATWHEFDENVLNFAGGLKFDISDSEAWYKIRLFFDLSFNGFQMIPPSGGGSSFLFGAETMGSLINSLCGSFNVPYHEFIWETPMCVIGHAMAAKARANGAEGVGRPKDPDDIRKQLILATAREYKGELHPWQINEPLKRKLTPIQMKHPRLVKEFDELIEKAAKRIGIKKPKVK